MIADAPRIKEVENEEGGEGGDSSKVVYRELRGKEDIKNYVKGLL